MESLSNFTYEYFVKPILSNGWFNPVNSITYGVILVVCVYFVFRLLKKMSIKIDRYFTYAILPFIFWASTTRVLHDAAYYGVLTGKIGEFYSLPIFPTPGSYFITFMLALVTLLVSLLFQKYLNISYWKVMVVIGIVLDVVNVVLLPIVDLFPMVVILGLTACWSVVFFGLWKLFEKTRFEAPKRIFTMGNSSLLSVHMLDASATYVALTFFGYLEQHPLPRFLIGLTNPAAMFFLKLAVLIPVLYVVDTHTEAGDFRNFLKIVILILGLAPGLRDMIRLMVGV